MSLKNKLLQTWHRYLQTNFNSYLRSAPLEGKQRLYKHVDIQSEFEKHEQERKRQRLQLIEYKQKLKKRMLEKELLLVKQMETSKIDFLQGGQTISSDERHSNEAQLKKEQLQKELEAINRSLDEIDTQKQELQTVEQSIAELEPDMVLLRGIEKKTVLTLINYYQFQFRHIAGLELNPETIKNFENVHYQVVNNLPVKRERLYEILPELFEKEIGEMEQHKQRLIAEKRPQLRVQESSVLQVQEKSDLDPEDDPDDPMLIYMRQEREMMQFIYNKCKHFTDKHHDWIEMKLRTGFQNFEAILENFEYKKEEDLHGEDLEAYRELQELFKIQEDYEKLIEINKVQIHEEQRKLVMPEYVEQHPVLRQAWKDKWEQIVKHSADFSTSLLLPHNSFESDFDKALMEQRKHDIQDLIAQSQEALKQKVGGEVPVRLGDRKDKDEELVKQVQVLADVMHQIPAQLERNQRKRQPVGRLAKGENPLLIGKSEEKRILTSELPKVLFLNNKDPKKFNLQFWAEHFNLEPQKLRNIFNYVTYPIVDEKNPQQVTSVLRFLY